MERVIFRKYTLGEVVDNLKEGDIAIKIEGHNKGVALTIEEGGLKDANSHQFVGVSMPSNSKYIIIKA